MPVVECAALYFLVRGLRQQQRWAVALGGVLLGAGLYTYGSYPFLLPLLAAPALLLILDRRGDRAGLSVDRQKVGDLALAGLAALAAAGPFLIFALRNPGALMVASNVQVFAGTDLFQDAGAVESAALFAARTLHAISAYFIGIQRDSVDGMGIWGILDPIAAVILAVGAAVALRRFLDWRYALVVCGLLAGILPVILLAPSHTQGMLWAEYRRSIIALPFVFAAVGLGADWLLGRAARWFSSAGRPWPAAPQRAAAVVVFLIVASSFLSVHHYFVSWARDDFSRWVFVHDLVQVAEFLEPLESEEPVVYFYSHRWSYDYPTRRFLLPDLPGKDRSAEFGDFGLTRLQHHRDRPVIYVLMPPYDRHLEEVKRRHPGGVVTRLADDGEVLFVAYHLPGAASDPGARDAGG